MRLMNFVIYLYEQLFYSLNDLGCPSVSIARLDFGLLVMQTLVIFKTFLGSKGHLTHRTRVSERVWKMLAFHMIFDIR